MQVPLKELKADLYGCCWMQPGFLGRLCDADMITYYIDSLYINVNLDKVV